MESYARGETTPPLLEETIGANVERTVAAHADREALVEVASGRCWTWAELDRDVDALARGLVAAGLAKGDRVGLDARARARVGVREFHRPGGETHGCVAKLRPTTVSSAHPL
jgi:non-ribosomal peptide synthetase component F